MLFALQMVDLGVLALYLAAILAIGLYFRPAQHTSRDYFFGGRSLSWLPVGLSLITLSHGGQILTEMPGEAYGAGLKMLLLPAIIWISSPLLIWLFLPVYRGLELDSVYAYLELRFDAVVRFAGSLLFVVWRLIGLVATVYVPCKVLVTAAWAETPLVVLILVVGMGATACTLLGGMRGVVWTAALQGLVIFAGVLAVILGTWWNLDGGPTRVWEVATALGRTEMVDTQFSWSSSSTIWGMVPHYVMLTLLFYGADQITTQRFLSTKSLLDAQRSWLLHSGIASVVIPCMVYAGLCLLAFYHDHPDALRTKWVVNVQGETNESLTYGDRARFLGQTPTASDKDQPLIDWRDPRDAVNVESLDRLVRERRLLHPNRKTPFENPNDLRDPNDPDRLNLEQLATRHPPKSNLRRGEVVLHTRATGELMPWFAVSRLPFGITGFVLAGFLAATMASVSAGLLSLSTVLVIDVHRRAGWGGSRLARQVSNTDRKRIWIDDLRLGRLWTLLLGVASTGFACALATVSSATMEDILSHLLGAGSAFGAPLLGVFLLGLLTRRGTALGAMIALVGGILLTGWLAFEPRLSHLWTIPFGTLFTFATGFVASLFCGRRRDRQTLRGLVVGCGGLGTRDPRSVRRDEALFQN